MTTPRVLNLHQRTRETHGSQFNGGVFIGRPSKFGNPFRIGRDGTRAEVIEKYQRWVHSKPEILATIREELRGKNLICYCAPLPCHGDVLLEIANTCPDCHHSLIGNDHGLDQNDATIDPESGELVHSGRCTYCRVCRSGAGA